jgi:hypothetical protein
MVISRVGSTINVWSLAVGGKVDLLAEGLVLDPPAPH